MEKLEDTAENIRIQFDAQTKARDLALSHARSLTRSCSLSIRAVHRNETETMQKHLDEAGELAMTLRSGLSDYPFLFFAGYTQDALKEYAEAKITCALIRNEPLPTHEDLNLPPNTYLNGLAESVGEMRRRCLDMLRQDNFIDAERMLGYMDDVFAVLVTMDYADAITNGLRRQTDVARAIIERTRGDVTFSLRGEKLEHSLLSIQDKILGSDKNKKPPKSFIPSEDI
jgi:translin